MKKLLKNNYFILIIVTIFICPKSIYAITSDYIINDKININPILYIFYIIPIIFLIITVLIWHKFGKNEKIIETIEMYPPKALNSLEVAFYNKGSTTKKDATTLLIYLANKGYINISISNKQVPSSKTKDFKITKLKEYDGTNIYEQQFLEGLFQKKDKNNPQKKQESNKDSVTKKELQNNFYATIIRILKNINNKENRNKIFEQSSLNKRMIIILMIIISYLLINIIPIIQYKSTDIKTLIFCVLLSLTGFFLLFNILTGKYSKSIKLISTILFGSVAIIPPMLIVLPKLLYSTTNLFGYLMGLLSIEIMIILTNSIKKRTLYDNEILGKIKSFKKFLQTIDKKQLEEILKQDPNYFYYILPYTNVLGISKQLIKKIENINMQEPTWYNTKEDFELISFYNNINNIMIHISTKTSSK